MLLGPLYLPSCLCWQLAAKFNELRQVVSLTQIKIMLMNKARAREREKERKIVCRHSQITAKDDGNVLFVLCFSFCLMSARLRRGGNANPDRDSTSLLPACHMAASSACAAASAAPVTPTTPLINFAVAFFAYFCFAFHFRNTKFLLSLCLIFVFHFSLCTALIWWRHNAALSLALVTLPISLYFRGSTSASLCSLTLCRCRCLCRRRRRCLCRRQRVPSHN